jgi:hypothetical protein
MKGLVNMLNKLSFERLDHDLKYEEYIKLLDVHQALKLEAPENLQITNKNLSMGLEG